MLGTGAARQCEKLSFPTIEKLDHFVISTYLSLFTVVKPHFGTIKTYVFSKNSISLRYDIRNLFSKKERTLYCRRNIELFLTDEKGSYAWICLS